MERKPARAVAAVMAALLLAGLAGCGTYRGAEPANRGTVTIEYRKVGTSLRPLERALRDSGRLERAARQVTRIGGLPRDVRVVVESCSDGTAYVDGKRLVEFCLQDFVETRDLLAEAGDKRVIEKVVTIAEASLLHELGHALIDVRRLPATGRDEDAADQFAVWQAVTGLHDPDLVLASAREYELDNLAFEQTDDDEHGSDGQRAVNLLCWLYGSEPKRWRGLVDGDPLTKYRARQCGYEWDSLSYAWAKLLSE